MGYESDLQDGPLDAGVARPPMTDAEIGRIEAVYRGAYWQVYVAPYDAAENVAARWAMRMCGAWLGTERVAAIVADELAR